MPARPPKSAEQPPSLVTSVPQYRECLQVSYTINADLRRLTLLAMGLGAFSTVVCGHAFAAHITQLLNPFAEFDTTRWFMRTMVAAMATLLMAGFTCTAVGIFLDIHYDEDAITRWGEDLPREDAMDRASLLRNRLWALIPFGLDLWFR
ncbi:hypothetical protein QQZ08_002593 [Neonectria magnoliae]|uniref:Uncharacterized protein n=1 Tax=Neonectria magnoliae TaxID=2732573 RepID=A0ABR1ICT8_9HYPO